MNVLLIVCSIGLSYSNIIWIITTNCHIKCWMQSLWLIFSLSCNTNSIYSVSMPLQSLINQMGKSCTITTYCIPCLAIKIPGSKGWKYLKLFSMEWKRGGSNICLLLTEVCVWTDFLLCLQHRWWRRRRYTVILREEGKDDNKTGYID